MKIKAEKINLPSSLQSLRNNEEEMVSTEDVIKNEAKISEYINASRLHLEALKVELYKVLDAGHLTAEHYKTDLNSLADFSVKPSVFLEKAFTMEAYDAEGKGIENRDQPYINAGTQFAKYCENNASTLNEDQLLSDDASKIIGAVNTAISQLNKVEARLKLTEYERAAGALSTLPEIIDTVIDQAAQSKLVAMVPNQSIIQKIMSGLSDLVKSIGTFLSNIGKSEEQKNIENFSSFKEQYKASYSQSVASFHCFF